MNKRAFQIVTLPARKFLALTVLIVTMGAMVNAGYMYYCIHAWIPPMSLVIQFTRAIILSWVVVWIYAGLRRLSNIAAKVWISLVIVLLSINCALDLFVYQIYKIHFTHDFLVAIMDSCRVEVRDFLSAYLSLPYIFSVLCCAFVFWLIYRISEYIQPLIRKSIDAHLKLWIISVSLTLTACMWINLTYNHVMGANTDIVSKMISVSKYRPAQKITALLPYVTKNSSEAPPAEIVIIVGESHSKDHSQIYGYPLPTQPKLSSMANDSLIIVFNHAKTPSSYTVGTFREIIGTWNHTLPEDSMWYECPTFLQVADVAGYNTAWISNQNRYGLGDSPIGIMAETADTSIWSSKVFDKGLSYDETLLPLINERVNYQFNKKLYLIHLVGNHMLFNDRFPNDRAYFHTKDYGRYHEWQRQTMADYDNSVLYNDSVLTEIFNIFMNRDALVIYFSDHGEDLYQSSDVFYGHGQSRGTKSYFITENIPFIVFVGGTFKKKHPELYRRMLHSVDDTICTTDLTYTLMDIMGLELKGHPKARSHSFFKDR